MDYASDILRALTYMESHLCDAHCAAAAARAAGYSPSYFGRIFSVLCGCSPAEYLRMRRLTLAGDALAEGAGVLQTALRFGYDSPEGFARAFAKFHGILPSKAKQQAALLKTFPNMAVQKPFVKGSDLMEHTIVTMPAFCVLQKAERHTTAGGDNLRSIPDFWARSAADGTLETLCACTGTSTTYGICWGGSEEQETFCYGIAAPCGPDVAVPEGYTLREIPARTWAVFPCKGAMPGAIQQLWQRILTEFFPSSSFRPTGELDMEVYPEGDMDSPDYLCEIRVPIES